MTYTKDSIIFVEPKRANFHDITGQIFHRLTALGYAGIVNGYKSWYCECICGNVVLVTTTNLKSGATKSCGCLRQENIRKVATLISNRGGRKSHGASYTPLYRIWADMRQRCMNPKYKQFKDYGGRGITVCDRWDDFTNFAEDMGERPSSKHSLERIDNNKGYSPDNCKWATPLEQGNNRRNNRLITYQGKTQSLSVWCRELHLSYNVTYARLLYGWSTETAFTTP